MMSKVELKATEDLKNAILSAMRKGIEGGALPQADIPDFAVEVPTDHTHGDRAANAAMVSAKAFHSAPRKIAEVIEKNIDLSATYFDR